MVAKLSAGQKLVPMGLEIVPLTGVQSANSLAAGQHQMLLGRRNLSEGLQMVVSTK